MGSPARLAIVVVAMLLEAGVALGQTPADADAGTLGPGVLRVRVTGLRNDHGHVACALFDGPRGFPDNARRAVQKELVRPRHGAAVCTFHDVRSGTYAVDVFHDENDNRKLDKGPFGIPTEGYGASNDAHSTFGPPKWKDARFRYDGSGRAMHIRMRY